MKLVLPFSVAVLATCAAVFADGRIWLNLQNGVQSLKPTTTLVGLGQLTPALSLAMQMPLDPAQPLHTNTKRLMLQQDNKAADYSSWKQRHLLIVTNTDLTIELAGVDANELLAHAQQVWMPQVQQRMGDRIAVETLDAYSPAMDQSTLEREFAVQFPTLALEMEFLPTTKKNAVMQQLVGFKRLIEAVEAHSSTDRPTFTIVKLDLADAADQVPEIAETVDRLVMMVRLWNQLVSAHLQLASAVSERDGLQVASLPNTFASEARLMKRDSLVRQKATASSSQQKYVSKSACETMTGNCSSHGVCNGTANNFACRCQTGWTGYNCYLADNVASFQIILWISVTLTLAVIGSVTMLYGLDGDVK